MANRCFSYAVGPKGSRVRVFERARGGTLYISAWDPTLREGRGGYRRQSLGHRIGIRPKRTPVKFVRGSKPRWPVWILARCG